MAINVSVQFNGGLLPDIILLTQCYYHWGTRLNATKRFLGGRGGREGPRRSRSQRNAFLYLDLFRARKGTRYADCAICAVLPSPPPPQEPLRGIPRGQSATCRGVKYVSSRGISGDFRNPTALVRVFSPSRGNLKQLPSRGIFMSPSSGISGDFRNPTALVRVFSSEGI